MTEPDDLATRLHEAAAAFLALRQAVLAREPWPLAAAFDSSTEAQWGPPEVLAHLAEMLPYWLGEVERIVAAAPTPAPFGRAANDGVRLAIIGRDRTVPLRELFDRVTSDSTRFERRLAGLRATDLDRVGLHPVGGPVAAGDVVEGFVVAHLADHAAQLRELLSMLDIETLDYASLSRISLCRTTAAETPMQRPTPDDDPDAWPAPTDLADSIDLRLLMAGRLTPTAIPIRRDRAELAAVLGHAPQPYADPRTDTNRERNAA